MENAFRRFVAYAQGTWLVSVWLRCLGARIGSWVTFRFCNVQTAPDMLNIGDGTHVGDMANMVSALAIDANTVMVAPIEIGKQVGADLAFKCRTSHLACQYPWKPRQATMQQTHIIGMCVAGEHCQGCSSHTGLFHSFASSAWAIQATP